MQLHNIEKTTLLSRLIVIPRWQLAGVIWMILTDDMEFNLE